MAATFRSGNLSHRGPTGGRVKKVVVERGDNILLQVSCDLRVMRPPPYIRKSLTHNRLRVYDFGRRGKMRQSAASLCKERK